MRASTKHVSAVSCQLSCLSIPRQQVLFWSVQRQPETRCVMLVWGCHFETLLQQMVRYSIKPSRGIANGKITQLSSGGEIAVGSRLDLLALANWRVEAADALEAPELGLEFFFLQ